MISTPNETAEVGRVGEQMATQFLEKNGYTVIARNVRSGHKEIDVIVRDEHYLVFVEVKTRSCLSPEDLRYGRPATAVNRKKQSLLVMAARNYLRSHPALSLQPRLDVIEVYLRKNPAFASGHELLKINHIRNAFLAK